MSRHRRSSPTPYADTMPARKPKTTTTAPQPVGRPPIVGLDPRVNQCVSLPGQLWAALTQEAQRRGIPRARLVELLITTPQSITPPARQPSPRAK